jgi:hypothetical protein
MTLKQRQLQRCYVQCLFRPLISTVRTSREREISVPKKHHGLFQRWWVIRTPFVYISLSKSVSKITYFEAGGSGKDKSNCLCRWSQLWRVSHLTGWESTAHWLMNTFASFLAHQFVFTTWLQLQNGETIWVFGILVVADLDQTYQTRGRLSSSKQQFVWPSCQTITVTHYVVWTVSSVKTINMSVCVTNTLHHVDVGILGCTCSSGFWRCVDV